MLLTICMMTMLMHDSVSASNVRLNRTQVQIVRGDTYRLYVKGTTAKVNGIHQTQRSQLFQTEK